MRKLSPEKIAATVIVSSKNFLLYGITYGKQVVKIILSSYNCAFCFRSNLEMNVSVDLSSIAAQQFNYMTQSISDQER